MAGAASQRKHEANSTMQIYSTVPHIFIFVCRHVYRISQVGKKKHPLCFSNAVLAILCGDSVNFRSGGSVLGLRVHHSVRYNYEKLIPGRPVWHFMHDVSYGYLMHSSLTVQPHTFEYMDTYTHILWTQNFSHTHIPTCWQLHKSGNCPGSFVPPVNNWIVTDTCAQTNALAHSYTPHRQTPTHITLPGILQVCC